MEPKKVMCWFDTAIERRAMVALPDGTIPLRKYINTRDEKDIVDYLIPGVTPTRFNINRLSRAVMNNTVLKEPSEQEKNRLCFTYGVLGIEGVVLDDGRVTNLAPSGVVGDMRYWTQADLEQLSPAEVQEIGFVVYQYSFLPTKMYGNLQPLAGSVALLEAATT